VKSFPLSAKRIIFTFAQRKKPFTNEMQPDTDQLTTDSYYVTSWLKRKIKENGKEESRCNLQLGTTIHTYTYIHPPVKVNFTLQKETIIIAGKIQDFFWISHIYVVNIY